ANAAFTMAVTMACPQALRLGFIVFRLFEGKTVFYSSLTTSIRRTLPTLHAGIPLLELRVSGIDEAF
ncbi:MAG: hypothetical protein ACTILN_00865, partial [Marinobacter sp.]